MKKILQTSLIFIIVAFSASSSLASSIEGKIAYILPHPGDQVFFNMVGITAEDINGQGTNGNCITTNSGIFRIDLSQPTDGRTNETGPAPFAALLAAQAQDRSIRVNGANSCTAARENVSWILVR